MSNDQRGAMLAALAYDMAAALAELHDKAEVVHLDLKGLNFLVNANGLGQLMDFGTSLHRDEATLSDFEMGQLRWLSPELIEDKVDLRAIKTPKRSATPAEKEKYKEEYLKANKLIQPSAEIWSLGVSMLEALNIPSIMQYEPEMASEYGVAVKKYKNAGDGQPAASDAEFAALKLDPGLSEEKKRAAEGQWFADNQKIFKATGDKQLDALLSAMLAGNAATRPSAKNVTEHEYFQNRGADLRETRQLIAATCERSRAEKSEDRAALDAASNKFDAARVSFDAAFKEAAIVKAELDEKMANRKLIRRARVKSLIQSENNVTHSH